MTLEAAIAVTVTIGILVAIIVWGLSNWNPEKKQEEDSE